VDTEEIKAELENLISSQISMFAFCCGVEIQTVKIKAERTDSIFGNPGGKSFVCEINLK